MELSATFRLKWTAASLPLVDLISSNECPTASEAAIAVAIVDGIRSDLVVLDEETKLLEAHFNGLKSLHRDLSSRADTDQLLSLQTEMERVRVCLRDLYVLPTKLGKAMDDHQAILAPMRRLPDMLLSEIFLMCEDGHTVHVNDPRATFFAPPRRRVPSIRKRRFC